PYNPGDGETPELDALDALEHTPQSQRVCGAQGIHHREVHALELAILEGPLFVVCLNGEKPQLSSPASELREPKATIRPFLETRYKVSWRVAPASRHESGPDNSS